MKQLIIFTFLFLGVIFTSCKKEHKVTIQTQDLITGDGSAYAGMPFVVTQVRTGTFENKSKRVYEGELDENGHASFLLKMHKDWRYILNITQPDNICHGGVLKDYLDNESSNHVVVDYLKCGYFIPKSKNINCEGNDDELRFKFYHTIGKDIYIYGVYNRS